MEVKFEDENQGAVQVVASPMVRLTNKPNSKIEEIGSPEKLISALGPFVTGNSFDPDEVVETHVEMRDNQTVTSAQDFFDQRKFVLNMMFYNGHDFRKD